MQLSHVCMWSEHGWKRVSAEEAAKIYPLGTVSARSGLFMCELCGQYVSLSGGAVYKRHFRHNKENVDKACPERTIAANSKLTLDESTRELPLKLIVHSMSEIELMIGVTIPSFGDKANSFRQKLRITSNDYANTAVYSLERINENGISYLSLGNDPCEAYNIELIPDNDTLQRFYPKSVDGVYNDGTLFYFDSGKKLPIDSDVTVGRKYLLLTTNRFFRTNRGIDAQEICRFYSKRKEWKVFEIIAHSFDENTARFFLDYHYRLTENVTSIIPLWPIVVKSPYMIHSETDELTLYVKGDCGIKVNPDTNVRQYTCEAGKVVRLSGIDRNQLLSVGRTRVLDYVYFRKGIPKLKTRSVEISVTDINGNSLGTGSFNELPTNNTIIITVPFDGTIIVDGDRKTREQIKVYAGSRNVINKIRFGTSIAIRQGLDEICQLEFNKAQEPYKELDELLYKDIEACSGAYITVLHSLGSLVSKMEDYPKTKRWLYQCLRKGAMPRKAYRLLISHFGVTN